MKFKIGDKVRITDRGIFRYNYRVGDTAIIESIHDDLFVLSMRGGGKQNVLISHADEYIEKVEECTMKFNVGDRVSIDGLTGTIDAMGDDGYLVAGHWYGEEHLTAAPSKLAALLGVKDNEPLNVVDEDGDPYDDYLPWRVENNVLIDCVGDSRDIPSELFTGKYKAVSFKPNGWHDNYSVYYIDAHGEIRLSDFSRISNFSVALVLSGNAFHTKAEAEENQPRISAEIIKKLGEC